MTTGTDIQINERIKQSVREPKQWKVVFINDDVTPADFVETLLITIFKHSVESAELLTLLIDQTGSGVAGVYSHEIAEAKSCEATLLSRNNGFPLQIKIEIDD